MPTSTPHDGVVLARIAALSDQAWSTGPADQHERIGRLRARLAEPLQVAVAGRVKAGKSTMVNALLGQRVARTDARECTRVVTWFRYGPSERVTVLGRDGSRTRTRLDSAGLVPEDLGRPLDQIAAVEVELSLVRLRAFSLADTPGLDSPEALTSQTTTDLLGVDSDSQAAIAAAEAVLFVLNQTVRQSDVDVLRGFRALAHGAGNDVVSAFAVLNKADLFDGPDPMVTGARIAARFAAELRGEVAGVLPYSGLLAEVARCGLFTEADATALGQLAGLDQGQRERMLLSEASFYCAPSELPEASRRRLWGLLREAGVRVALQAIDEGASGASAVRSKLAARSGHPDLDGHLTKLFESNASALKATAALADLEAIAWIVGGSWGAELRDRIEAMRLDPHLHVLAEMAALRQLHRGEVTLPSDLADELADFLSTPPAARTDTAAGLRRWQTYANSDVRPVQAQVARVMVRSYELASQQRCTP
ncbi:MAG: dynamin family protein [Geodermatophilaceae bacterium]